LIPREGNAQYYKQTRLPISLKIIEEKLNKGEFSNLAELESYFKRMIANAKEFYPRSSQVFDDAERVRKALSNYMTKTNPAYNNRNYHALPTPLPPEDDADVDEDADGEDDDEAEADDDANGEDADGEEQEGDENDDDDEEGDEDADGEDDAEAEDDEDEGPSSRRRSIVLKRRGPGRPPRNSVQAQPSPRTSNPPSRPDHQYEGVPYKGLTFQQAQEKIVEELIRHQEPE
jgi:hypothetical protein